MCALLRSLCRFGRTRSCLVALVLLFWVPNPALADSLTIEPFIDKVHDEAFQLLKDPADKTWNRFWDAKKLSENYARFGKPQVVWTVYNEIIKPDWARRTSDGSHVLRERIAMSRLGELIQHDTIMTDVLWPAAFYFRKTDLSDPSERKSAVSNLLSLAEFCDSIERPEDRDEYLRIAEKLAGKIPVEIENGGLYIKIAETYSRLGMTRKAGELFSRLDEIIPEVNSLGDDASEFYDRVALRFSLLKQRHLAGITPEKNRLEFRDLNALIWEEYRSTEDEGFEWPYWISAAKVIAMEYAILDILGYDEAVKIAMRNEDMALLEYCLEQDLKEMRLANVHSRSRDFIELFKRLPAKQHVHHAIDAAKANARLGNVKEAKSLLEFYSENDVMMRNPSEYTMDQFRSYQATVEYLLGEYESSLERIHQINDWSLKLRTLLDIGYDATKIMEMKELAN